MNTVSKQAGIKIRVALLNKNKEVKRKRRKETNLE